MEFFRDYYGMEEVISHGDFLSHCRSEPIPDQVMRNCHFVSGHFGYDQVADYLEGAYSFTFLRDPVERLLSFYRFCMNEDMQQHFAVARAARDLGLDGFVRSQLPEVVEMLDNQQTWQLARMYWSEDREALAHLSGEELLALAQEHMSSLSHVGLTETFEADFRHILRDLQMDESVAMPRELRTVNPVGRAQLSTESLELLQSRVQLDAQLYQGVLTARGVSR